MKVQFLGSGDAFGSGGRYQTCIYVNSSRLNFLLDCGASSLIAMKKFGVDPKLIDYIFLTHLHGDHFGGIPFLLREFQVAVKRDKPLVIAGPQGLESKIRISGELLFPGFMTDSTCFPVHYIELSDNKINRIDDFKVSSFEALHTCGTKPKSLRIEFENRVISYSGDTEWNENLFKVADRADLFICECYGYEKPIKNHLNYVTIMQHRQRLNCRRLIATHMGAEMLKNLEFAELEFAEDGREVYL